MPWISFACWSADNSAADAEVIASAAAATNGRARIMAISLIGILGLAVRRGYQDRRRESPPLPACGERWIASAIRVRGAHDAHSAWRVPLTRPRYARSTSPRTRGEVGTALAAPAVASPRGQTPVSRFVIAHH